jgi:hypothetical protein
MDTFLVMVLSLAAGFAGWMDLSWCLDRNRWRDR